MDNNNFHFKQVKAEAERNEKGLKIITKKYVKQLCEENELYITPHLNDKLYLHFKGFCAIDNIEEYVNLKALFLDNNCIRKIENLSMLKQLTCLYLQSNIISKIEGLDELTELVTLNLSHNQITKVENLNNLINLSNIDLSFNYIENCENLSGLLECQSLTNIDLSQNKILYSEHLLDLFEGMKNLACLYLKGNPFVRDFPNYRKSVVSTLKNLKYLDDKPINNLERRAFEAWKEGGREAELAERNKYFEEKKEIDRQYALENIEHEVNARAKRKKELERIEKELNQNKERLLKQKEEIINSGIDDDDSRIMLYQIDEEIKRYTELMDIKEEKEGSKVEQELIMMPKYKCLYVSKDKNGEDVYYGYSKEEIEEHNRKRNAEWAAQEEKEKLNKQKQLEENLNSDQSNNKNSNIDDSNLSKLEKDNGFIWVHEMDNYLEELLEKNFFDFSKTREEFNKAINLVNLEKNIPQIEITEEDLRERWTQIQNEKYRSLEDSNKESQKHPLVNIQSNDQVNTQSNYQANAKSIDTNDKLDIGTKLKSLPEDNSKVITSQFDELE